MDATSGETIPVKSNTSATLDAQCRRVNFSGMMLDVAAGFLASGLFGEIHRC